MWLANYYFVIKTMKGPENSVLIKPDDIFYKRPSFGSGIERKWTLKRNIALSQFLIDIVSIYY